MPPSARLKTSTPATLTKRDLQVIIGRSLRDEQPLTIFDLKNSNDADLMNLEQLVRQEISLRLIFDDKNVKRTDPLTGGKFKSDAFTTTRQLATLRSIEQQIISEQHTRKLLDSWP